MGLTPRKIRHARFSQNARASPAVYARVLADRVLILENASQRENVTVIRTEAIQFQQFRERDKGKLRGKGFP